MSFHSVTYSGRAKTPALPSRLTVTKGFSKKFSSGVNTMQFYITMIPPTATAQEKKVSVVNGKPVFYNPPAVKKARAEMRLLIIGIPSSFSICSPVATRFFA